MNTNTLLKEKENKINFSNYKIYNNTENLILNDIEKNVENKINKIENKINKIEKKSIRKKGVAKTSSSKLGKDSAIIKNYLEEISKYKLLSFEEEKELSRKIQKNNDKYALEKLINSNLRLVVKLSRNYVSQDYPQIDVIQDGNIGLIKAAKKYDYKKDVKFSTYASWLIKQTIIRSLTAKKRMIKLPSRKEEKLKKINREKNRYFQINKEIPTNEQLSQMLNISKKEIKEISVYSNKIMSFEDKINCSNESEAFTIKDTLYDECYNPDNLTEAKILGKETKKIIDSLIPKERIIILHRFGFVGKEKKYTLKAIGEMFGISPETVRKIEVGALKKLKEHFPHLKDFLN